MFLSIRRASSSLLFSRKLISFKATASPVPCSLLQSRLMSNPAPPSSDTSATVNMTQPQPQPVEDSTPDCAPKASSGPKLPLVSGKELRFPTSWGYIAAKEWGDKYGHPVLCIHGWLDNVGSFEPVVPYLLQEHNLHIVAVDEPGCGLSTHKPPGSDYNRWAHLREIKRLLDQLNWKEVTIIGHSLGAAYSLLFAAIYPELVKAVIAIDVPKPLTMINDNWASRVPKAIEKHIKYDLMFQADPTLESTAKVYPEEVALKKMMEGHGSSLTEEAARVMMVRGSRPFKDGVIFTRDVRQKLPSLDPSPTEETMLKFMDRMRGDLLIVRGKQSAYQVPRSSRQPYYEMYERNCRIFQDVLLDGTHHLHMNNPDTVGPAMNKFLAQSFASRNGFGTLPPKASL